MKTAVLLAVCFFVLAVGIRRASATMAEYEMHGSSCIPVNGSLVNYGSFGVNATSGAATVNCPLPLWDATNSGVTINVDMRVYDRSIQNFICHLIQTDQDGNILSDFVGQTFSVNQAAALSMSTIEVHAVGYPYLQCVIPAPQSGSFSHLISYKVACTAGQQCLKP